MDAPEFLAKQLVDAHARRVNTQLAPAAEDYLLKPLVAGAAAESNLVPDYWQQADASLRVVMDTAVSLSPTRPLSVEAVKEGITRNWCNVPPFCRRV
jgi:hypothetical protein